MTHGEAVRSLRQALDLTQETFGARCGFTRVEVTNIEAGRRNLPDVHTRRVAMAQGLGVSVERLDAYLDGTVALKAFAREVAR